MASPQKTEHVELLNTSLKGSHGRLLSVHHFLKDIAMSQGSRAISTKPIFYHMNSLMLLNHRPKD